MCVAVDFTNLLPRKTLQSAHINNHSSPVSEYSRSSMSGSGNGSHCSSCTHPSLTIPSTPLLWLAFYHIRSTSLSPSLVLLPLLGTAIDVFEFYFKKYASHSETCVVSWALVETRHPSIIPQVQESAKRWTLGCVNPAFWLPLATGSEFTQPTAHL